LDVLVLCLLVVMLMAGSVSLCRYLSQVISGGCGLCSTHLKTLFCVTLMQIALASSPPTPARYSPGSFLLAFVF